MAGKNFHCVTFTALLLAFAGLSISQSGSQAALEEVFKTFEQGNAAEAERRVIAILSKEPSNLHALVLAGAVLDSQRRYDEAERYYPSRPASLAELRSSAEQYG